MDVSIGNGNPSTEDVHLGQGLSEGQSGVKLSRGQKRKLRKRRMLEGLENSHTGGGDEMVLENVSSMRDSPRGHVESIVKLSSEPGLEENESNGVLGRSKKERMRKRRNREKNRVNALENSDVCKKMDDQLAVNVSLSLEICQGKEGNSMDNRSNSLNSSIDSQMAYGREFRKEDLKSVKQAVELKNVKETSLILKKESDSWRSKNTSVLNTRDFTTFKGKESLKGFDRKRRKCFSGINSEPIKYNMKQASFDHKEKEHKNGFSENRLTVTEEKDVASEQVMEETSARNLAHLSALKECRKRMKRQLKEASRGNSLMKGMSQTASNKSLEKVYHPNRKLLVLDLNGILVDVVNGGKKPDIRVSAKSVYKRPFCDDFLSFCFERFNVGVWSSRREKNVMKLVNFIFGESKQNLLFCWNQKHCTETRFKTINKPRKPLVLKELRKLWEKWNPNFPWEMGECNESNTLLLDDSPYKALRNPAHTAIFPYPYGHNNVEDFSLGPGGDIRVYLEGIAAAENVQNYVKQNPFGQPAITESDPSWHFYLKVIGATQNKGHHKFDTTYPPSR
ncbi:hypothetical protein SLA2020_003290 [Shorea laevis]